MAYVKLAKITLHGLDNVLGYSLGAVLNGNSLSRSILIRVMIVKYVNIVKLNIFEYATIIIYSYNGLNIVFIVFV